MIDDFFSGVEQVEMKYDGGKGMMPIFYREARSFTIMLPANWSKLRRALPDPRFQPAQVLPGVGAVALTAFEYYDTDVKPYNEFSIGIVLNNPYYAPVPCYNMARQYLARFYYVYVHRLPVTTKIALRAGIDFYNYPKFIADIEFSDLAEMTSCNLSEGGRSILTVTGKKIPAWALGEMKFMCGLYQYGKPQVAEFKLNVIEGSIRWLPRDVAWEISGDHPIGRELKGLLLGGRALMYLYMPKVQGILYGPENLSFPLINRAIEASGIAKPPARPARKPAAKKPSGKSKSAKGKSGAKK